MLFQSLNLCPCRGLFIIDPNGIVKHMSINDLPVGRSVEETLRLVKAFQFVESHGEVCPASWTPKSPTVNNFRKIWNCYKKNTNMYFVIYKWFLCISDKANSRGVQGILWKSQLRGTEVKFASSRSYKIMHRMFSLTLNCTTKIRQQKLISVICIKHAHCVCCCYVYK